MNDLAKLEAMRLNLKMGVLISTSDCRVLLAMIDCLLDRRPHLFADKALEGWQAYLPPPPEEDPLKRAMDKVERQAAAAKTTLFDGE